MNPHLRERAEAMLKAVKDGTYKSPPIPCKLEEDIDPCVNCGRVIYAGKCCSQKSKV